jgi:hypothetical protein
MSTEQHDRAMSHWGIARENVTTVSDWGTKRKWTESVKTQARTPLTPTAQAKAQQGGSLHGMATAAVACKGVVHTVMPPQACRAAT